MCSKKTVLIFLAFVSTNEYLIFFKSFSSLRLVVAYVRTEKISSFPLTSLSLSWSRIWTHLITLNLFFHQTVFFSLFSNAWALVDDDSTERKKIRLKMISFRFLPERCPGLQRAVGSQYLWALAGSRSESEPHPRRRPRRADGAAGAVRPDPGTEHEAHLPQPCGAGCPKLRWVWKDVTHAAIVPKTQELIPSKTP